MKIEAVIDTTPLQRQFEIANQTELQCVEDANLALIDRHFEDKKMVYGENPLFSGGEYMVDIFDQSHINRIFRDSGRILNFNMRSRAYQWFRRLDIQKADPKNIEYMVFNHRTMIQQLPATLDDYKGQPYYGIKDPKDRKLFERLFGSMLNAETPGLVNEPAIVLAETSINGENWLKIRTSTVDGWVRNDDSILRGLSAKDIDFDPARPATSLKEIEAEEGTKVGVITAYGLTLDNGNILRPVNDLAANSKKKFPGLISLEDFKKALEEDGLSDEEVFEMYNKQVKDPEIYGDGITEEGESALFSLGNNIKVINYNPSNEYHTVVTPKGEQFKVHKSHITIGYPKNTQQNMGQLVQVVNGKVYSWGGSNGTGGDCSFTIYQLLAATGRLIPRVGNPQRYGMPDKTFTYAAREDENESIADFMPRTIDDLTEKDLLGIIKWGNTIFSWGGHVILALGVYKDGRIAYAHNVMGMKGKDENPSIKLARMVVGPIDNEGDYYFDKETLEFKRYEDIRNWFKPDLPLGNNPKSNFVNMVVFD